MAKTEKSQTACFYPIVAAIQKADDIIGKNHKWQPHNQEQMAFLSDHYGPCAADIAKIPEIQSMASFDADEINKWLAEHKFSIKLDPFVEPEDFGTASILDVLVEWLNEGKVIPIHSGKREYPGVRLHGDGVDFYSSSGHAHPLVQLRTKSEDLVYITILDKPLSGAALLAKTADLIRNAEDDDSLSFGGVCFPKVKLDQKVDISWLKKMWTRTDPDHDYEIAQALQQTKIAMNEHGARAKSAVAVGFMKTTAMRPPPPDHIINKPFLFTLVRPGLARPLVAAYIERADWKDPGDLKDL